MRHLTSTRSIPSCLPGCPTQANLCICCRPPGQGMQEEDKTTPLRPGLLTWHRQHTGKAPDCWQPWLSNQWHSWRCPWTECISSVLPNTQLHSAQWATAREEHPEPSIINIWIQRWCRLNTNISFSPPPYLPVEFPAGYVFQERKGTQRMPVSTG